MEFIDNFSESKHNFTSKINDSKFIQGNPIIKEIGKTDISEMIIEKYEIECLTLNIDQRKQFVIKKKLEISERFNDFSDNYNNKFNESLVMSGFQKENVLSTVLFLNEYYKINITIYNKDTQKYYRTSLIDDYTPFIIIYNNNNWFHKEDEEMDHNINYGDIQDLNNILTLDCSIYIRKPYLQNIGKYKIKDLHEICEKMNLNIKNDKNKNKNKKELFDEINLKHYNSNI
jgi:hypothetical protein